MNEQSCPLCRASGKKGPGRPRKTAPASSSDSGSQGSAGRNNKLKARKLAMKPKASKQVRKSFGAH